MARYVSTPLIAVAALFACSFPFGSDNCEVDRIVASFDGSLSDELEVDLDRSDALAASNLAPPEFRAVYRLLFEGSEEAAGVAWTHGIPTGASDFFAIELAAPLVAGQTRAISSAYRGGGWGPLGSAREAAVALRVDTAWAATAAGQATIVQGEPLVLEIDVALTLTTGDSVTLRGTDRFRYDRGSCGDARRG